uniref:LigA n=1 Tax=Parastrongyloides trichosuri TaxID=131310 RepID=A0A0N4ZVQ0_PARTI
MTRAFRRRLARHAGLQPFALPAVAGLLLDGEAMLGQAAPHGPGDGEGGQPRAGRGARRDQGQDFRRPHAGVQRGRESIQEPGVGRARPLLQRPLGVADGQVDRRPPLRQVQPVKTRRPGGPGVQHSGGRLGQLGPGGQGARGFVARQREAFDGEDPQPRPVRARAPPQVQQGHDVQPSAETQLADGEGGSPGPGIRQAAALQEDRAGLGQAVVFREIDVAESARAGRAVFGPQQLRRGVVGGRCGGHGWGLSGRVVGRKPPSL